VLLGLGFSSNPNRFTHGDGVRSNAICLWGLGHGTEATGQRSTHGGRHTVACVRCGAPRLAASSRPPRQPPSSDNGAEPGVALCPASERLTYHQGSVLTGDIPMSILRYGKFTPALLRHGISLGIMVSTGDGANRSNVDAPVLVIMAIDSEDYVHVYAIKFIHREAEDSAESFRSF
jgi:hypothetical protein